MSIYYVYAYLRSKDSTTAPAGTPYYIGKGSNGRAYAKHGSINLPADRSNIVFLESNLSEHKAFEIEKFLIAYHGRIDNNTGILRNRTDGGEGTSGYIITPETKAKLSASKNGEKCYWFGKKRSEESKQNMSDAHIGKILSEETKQKISIANSGKKHHNFGKTGKKYSEETKQKMSDSARAAWCKRRES